MASRDEKALGGKPVIVESESGYPLRVVAPGSDETLDVQKVIDEWVPFTVSGAKTGELIKAGPGLLGPLQVEVVGTSIQFYDSLDGTGPTVGPLITTAGPKNLKGLTFATGLSYTSIGATHSSGGGYR